jgi:hypothetical protein
MKDLEIGLSEGGKIILKTVKFIRFNKYYYLECFNCNELFVVNQKPFIGIDSDQNICNSCG